MIQKIISTEEMQELADKGIAAIEDFHGIHQYGAIIGNDTYLLDLTKTYYESTAPTSTLVKQLTLH